MREAFLAIVPPGGAREGLERPLGRIAGTLARSHRMRRTFDGDPLVVFATPDTPTLPLEGGRGLVVGSLFHRTGEASPVSTSDPILGARAVASRGDSLLQEAWGGYAAFLIDPARERVDILRDPSGALACFHLSWGGCRIIFSDLAPVLALGLLAPEVDPGVLARHLLFPGLRTERTGLGGVSELLAGQRLTIERGAATARAAWSPWTFAAQAAQLGARKAAVAGVRAEVERVVRAWAGRSRSILLELSGGLDSSIIAVCLEAGAPVACVNLASDADPAADERDYAEAIAAAIGAPLSICRPDIEAVDVTRAPATTWPRPGLGAFQQIVDQAFIEPARRLQPSVFFTGAGGDNVFCYLATAAPATDALLSKGLGPTFLRALDDLSQLHGCTLWRAADLAFRKWARGRPPPWRRDMRFLASDLLQLEPDAHPWLDRPANALPGKIEHVASLMTIQCAFDGQDRLRLAPARHPLLSQPVVEHCLRTPTWMWIDGGRNRAVARDAFADRLPPKVAARRSKGDFSGVSGAIFARNRRQLADQLIGGVLDQMGLLDRASVSAYLDADGPPRDTRFYRLIEMAGAEAWARSWSRRPAPA